MTKLSISILACTILFSACTTSKQPEEISQLKVPDELEVKLWAASPMFYNPTNIDIDSRGRVWVTEAVNYRNFNNDSTRALHHSGGDRVMILEDRDEDGTAESSKVYVQDTDLIAPMGIAVIGNKVYVSCSPNLIVYTDTNGDDIPDQKEILLTGFGGIDHDHALHAVVGGPDGSLYFNTGNAGPHTVTDKSGWTLRSGSIYTGGSPYNKVNSGNRKSDDGKVWVGGLGLKFKQDGKGLEVIGHNFRNSYEITVDSKGDVWQNDNDDQVVTCRTSWLMERGNAGYFSTDGTRYWSADQRPDQDIFTAHWHQEDPGVMPAGDRTGAGSPTGVAFYEDDALGESYRGTFLSADAGRNLIFSYHPNRDQSGYDLGKRNIFLTSLDQDNAGYVWNDSLSNSNHNNWFRPSDVAMGTDGAVYVADWYDPVVGGHQMQDTAGYGRIYRISPKNKKLKRPVLDFTSRDGLINAFLNPAINVRFEAGNKLRAIGPSIIPGVKQVLDDSNPYHRARAIWLLSATGEEGLNIVKNLLNDKNEDIRIIAYRALRHQHIDLIPFAEKLIDDTSSFLRREIIQSLVDVPYENKKPILIHSLKSFNPMDRWYLEALGQALDGNEERFITDIDSLFNLKHIKPVEWNNTVEALVWRLHPKSQINNLALRAGTSTLSPEQRKRSITALAFIKDTKAVEAMIGLAKSILTDVKDQATYWLAFRQSNDWYDLYNWAKWNRNPATERKISEMKVRMAKLQDTQQSRDEKKWNAQSMAKDSIGANMILTMMENNKLPKDLYKEISSILLSHKDLSIRIKAGQLLDTSSNTNEYDITAISKLSGDANHGQELFLKNCLICHKMGDKGNDIGPDVQAIYKKFDRPALLDAIINPSAGIVFGYEAWTIHTKDGQSHFGFIVGENEHSITIKGLSGLKQTVALSEIASRKKMVKSLMPEAGGMKLSDKDLADLSEYLLGKERR